MKIAALGVGPGALAVLLVIPLYSQPPSEMREVIERYNADRGSLARFYTIDVSPKRHAKLDALARQTLADLNKLPFDNFSQEGKVDYVLLRNYLEHELRQSELQAKAYANMSPMLPFAQAIIDLEESRRNLDHMDSQKTAATLTKLAKQIEETRRTIAAGAPPKKFVANRAATVVGGLRGALKNWYEFYNGYDPQFTWWMGEPYKTVDKQLETYASLLREKLAGVKPGDEESIVGDPIGRDGLMSELAYEMIPYTPEQLIDLANKEFTWCEAEMKKASREMGFGDDWKKALEKVKTQYVEPGKQTELARDLEREAVEYVTKNNLLTVPPLAQETWRMEMMSPARQLVAPFFLGGETLLVAYPTNTMAEEAKMMALRGNNIHFSRAVVFHEMIPGHRLQQFMTERYNPQRRIFSTPFWMEGWALYWELLLYNRGFAQSPEDKVGMLFWRMHRCARIIFSLSFHMEKMTPEQAIDFLVDRVGHERDNAAAEVRRSFNGSYGPLYQAGYLLGGLQLFSLHHELVDGGKMTDRAFHDMVLHGNTMPIEMVRARVANLPLTRDYQSNWKFYGL